MRYALIPMRDISKTTSDYSAMRGLIFDDGKVLEHCHESKAEVFVVVCATSPDQTRFTLVSPFTDKVSGETYINLLRNPSPVTLQAHYGSDSTDPNHPRDVWRNDVVQEITTDGYWEWVAKRYLNP